MADTFAAIAKRYNLKLIVLFGSQATRKTHPGSDTDIGFTAEKHFGPAETARLALALSEVLQTKDVDLIDLRDAPPLLLKHVALNSRRLYEAEPGALASFRVYALKRYLETARIRRLREAGVDAFLKDHARQRTR